jgi:AraC family transcriptional regulator
VRQLTRGFRASRGCTIGEYAARNEIDRAKELLTAGESIKVIAASLGFASPSSFTYAFRRATGQTPAQFRKSESA